ncbi:type II toxin-antitoxin system ParD family antitoxin [Maricaulis sp.]|uniref:type II toxin-antitoxin system ParD family antitoxin n=1 Tax=Maricaulis sp. TaxID=1486257 RepID=UPI00261F8AA3|nr:type II toxin-antitoxin system ParD family antitoxin [Maricaulis sp.]
MATMNISLPQALKDWVEAQADRGLYANSSDYVRDLIRRDVERQEKVEALQGLVHEGEASGYFETTPQALYESIRKRYDPEK